MLTIAALASCSKEEVSVPPGPEGEGKVIELTIGGTPLSVKSTTASDNDADQAISDLTVFGVSTTGSIVTKKYFSGTDVTAASGAAKSVEFETKTTTESIYAIANIGSDLTGTDLNVSTLADLKKKTVSLLKSSAPSQTQGNVLMSGTTSTITLVSGTTYTADITLGFISSKLILSQLKRGAGSQGDYGTDFTIEAAILNNVQTSASYVATGGSYIPAALSWATGLTSSSITDKVADFNNAITIGTSQAADFDANKVVDLNYHWYVFENNDGSKPTTLLLHYKWKQKDQVMKDMYFPVTLKDGAGFEGKLEPGKAYAITMTLSGDFRTETDGGGSGGGGTEDPEKPVTNGSVTVTVTPTAWNTTSVDKEF
ncbi:MAG: fimbrial protein [Parabacteroides gordonii]|nr:fimbrial protein [Parabacteroides gordonii]